MNNFQKCSFSVMIAVIAIVFVQTAASAQTLVVNYDFASTTAGMPCVYGAPLTVASQVMSSYTTSTGNCTTPSGTASTAPPAFVANANNQSSSITGFATGNTQFYTFQIDQVANFSDYQIYFQAQRSGTGGDTITLQYSTDNAAYTNFQTVTLSAVNSFVGFNFDLTGVNAINNQPVVYFRIAVSNGANTIGTFRLDNFQARATLLLAANADVSGRVTDSGGNGLSKVQVKISGGGLIEPLYTNTNPFGYFRFEVPAGQTYIVSVRSKQYDFLNPSRVISVADSITDLNFAADER